MALCCVVSVEGKHESGMKYDPEGIFSKIIHGEIKANIVFESDKILAFEDVNPKAPVHILIVPKAQIATVNDFKPEDAQMIGEMVLAARQIAEEKGISQSGYRLVINTLADAGQEIFHVHLHLLGGRRLKWPPG